MSYDESHEIDQCSPSVNQKAMYQAKLPDSEDCDAVGNFEKSSNCTTCENDDLGINEGVGLNHQGCEEVDLLQTNDTTHPDQIIHASFQEAEQYAPGIQQGIDDVSGSPNVENELPDIWNESPGVGNDPPDVVNESPDNRNEPTDVTLESNDVVNPYYDPGVITKDEHPHRIEEHTAAADMGLYDVKQEADEEAWDVYNANTDMDHNDHVIDIKQELQEEGDIDEIDADIDNSVEEEQMVSSANTPEAKIPNASKWNPRKARIHPCLYCEKSFTEKSNLNRHLSMHTGEKPFKCDTCEMTFTHKYKLTNHARVHSIDRPFTCEICHKGFTMKHSLKLHESTHSGEKTPLPRIHQCLHCEKSFMHKSNLTRHLLMHSGEKPFKCDTCEMTFTHKYKLTNHQRVHSPNKPFTCLVCNKGFTMKNSLRQHSFIHTGEKPFKCSYCENRYILKGDLTRHELIHTGHKPFQCETCDRKFQFKCNLTKHEVIHTGVKPFKCQYCEKAFSQKCNLTMHERTHTGEKPFFCRVCGKKYTDQSNLKNHMRKHDSVESFFQCGSCKYSFKLESQLAEHVKKTHFLNYDLVPRKTEKGLREGLNKEESEYG
ncbi:unnamed protein product [Owenia fusiformis]|uniref:Uncharacterized protein n=1 Tax=Owenia fusiformis TaxID=6347 RepID=A0A8J1TA61_OWEFU|nr:unnamed protein product [Owenia fusiformis]